MSSPKGEMQEGRLVRRMTRQRREILDLLRTCDCHPDAYWIYEKVRQRIPQISLGTVYRALSFLSESGLIRELPYGDRHSHYDGNVHPHGHVVCQECGRIVDVPLSGVEELQGRAEEASGFRISDVRLEFAGLCPECVVKESGLCYAQEGGRLPAL